MELQWWAVLGVLVAVALWAMAVYNRLVQLRNRTANAFGQIDVQLKRRHDLVPNLVEVARGYLQHEASTLQARLAASWLRAADSRAPLRPGWAPDRGGA